jgi:hypothetical protein
MMRPLALLLLTANLLFFAWSRVAGENQPRLLAVAVMPRQAATAPAATTATSIATTAATTPTPPAPCTTLGPIRDETRAGNLQRQLEGAGLVVQRRQIRQQVPDGFGVYVEGFASAAEQARALRSLRSAVAQDAFPMPDDPQFRIAVGIFTARERAEDRARRVRALKLDAQVVDRMREIAITWLDLPNTAPAALTDARLTKAGVRLNDIESAACPAPDATPTS